MKLYTVGFLSRTNQDDFVIPDDAYVGDNIDRAKEQAEEFRHNRIRFETYLANYDVVVMDKTGHVFYSQPFVKETEKPASQDHGKRRQEWEKKS